MTRDEAIRKATGYADEDIRRAIVKPEPSEVFETDWSDNSEPLPVWIVHFDYILEEGACMEPSSLSIIINKWTGERIPFMAM